jgi:hypothetical protein
VNEACFVVPLRFLASPAVKKGGTAECAVRRGGEWVSRRISEWVSGRNKVKVEGGRPVLF